MSDRDWGGVNRFSRGLSGRGAEAEGWGLGRGMIIMLTVAAMEG